MKYPQKVYTKNFGVHFNIDMLYISYTSHDFFTQIWTFIKYATHI